MDHFLLFVFRVCRVFLSVHCSLVVTCREKADLLAVLCVVFYYVFLTLPCVVLGQVWCLIVSILDLCLLPYVLHITLQFLKWLDSANRGGGNEC